MRWTVLGSLGVAALTALHYIQFSHAPNSTWDSECPFLPKGPTHEFSTSLLQHLDI